MRKPYVGITGFMRKKEVDAILDAVPEHSDRLVMIGVLASLKTMRGIQNKWPNRYPAIDKIVDIFPDHPQALNLIHYNTKEKETLGDQLVAMTEFGGANMHGFQLNVKWPSPQILEKYRRRHPNMRIVLQVGGGAFKTINNSPQILARKVSDEYDGLVNYLLLDPSGGFGKPFDVARAREFLEALKERGVEQTIGLGVAGGLSPTTLDLVAPLVDDFPELSIDAEGRLRDHNDNLDLDLAKEYVANAMKMFRQEE